MVAIFTEKVMAEERAERLKNVEVLCQQGVLIPLHAEQEADVSIWDRKFSSLSPQNRKLMYRFGESVLNAGWWWEKDSNLRSL